MNDMAIAMGNYKILISACDKDKVLAHRWHRSGGMSLGGPYFAYCTKRPEHKEIMLHRFIVDCPSGMQVDHINGNTLDNRRENLRICTHAENMRNCRKNRKSTSGYKGVCWDKWRKRWVSFIQVNGKSINLGGYDDPRIAYEAYVIASKKYHGDFGRIS